MPLSERSAMPPVGAPSDGAEHARAQRMQGARRRIALVTPMLPVAHDPARGRYIHETARALSLIADVRVFFMQPRYPRLPGLAPRSFLHEAVGDDYTLDGIAVEAFEYPAVPGLSRVTNGVVAGRLLAQRMRAFAPEVAIGYWVYPDGYATAYAARRLGIPCIVGARGSDIHVRDRVNAYMTRGAIAKADLLLTVSKAMRQRAIDAFGADPERTRTIINGFDTSIFHPRPQAEMRAKLGIAPDARVVIYVGRFVETKGLCELLDAFASLAKRDPKLRLALVGDGVMRERLTAMIAEAGLARRVLMPGGFEPAQVAEWIAAADVLTLPSWSEGYPNVIVEAIACGRPVVATDVGGTREIADESSGILVPPRDARALEAALAEALARDWDRDAIAASLARNWSDVAADTLAACEDVIAAHARGETVSRA
ncbi:MAG TPA: glycosyltransferase [Rhodanobacteraceae bacterium]|nr:glycosyltransferase [Rhodanobacteraceae bacterium]